jgi:hypothetical protein
MTGPQRGSQRPTTLRPHIGQVAATSAGDQAQFSLRTGLRARRPGTTGQGGRYAAFSCQGLIHSFRRYLQAGLLLLIGLLVGRVDNVQPSRSIGFAPTAPVCPTWTRPVRTGPVMDACTVASSPPGSHAGRRRWSAALRGPPAAAPPPCCPRGFASAPQCPAGWPYCARRVHSDGCAVSTRTRHGVHSDRAWCPPGRVRGVFSDEWSVHSDRGPGVCCRPRPWPAGQRTARSPQGAAVCGAPP